MNGDIVLDYTNRGRPLTIGHIKSDVDEIWLDLNAEVVRVKLWQHQLDYLVKVAGGRNGDDYHGGVAPHLAEGKRIWGIPLTVRDEGIFGPIDSESL